MLRRLFPLLGVMALLAAGLLALSRQAGRQAVNLANGVTVRVLGVSYGTNDVCRPGGFMGDPSGSGSGGSSPGSPRPVPSTP
jgi:hypothetical protein